MRPTPTHTHTRAHARSSLLLAINIPSVILIIVYDLLQTSYTLLFYIVNIIDYRPINNNVIPTYYYIVHTCFLILVLYYSYFVRTRATRSSGMDRQGCLKHYIIIINNALYSNTCKPRLLDYVAAVTGSDDS